jgi:hypothetical protein
MTKLLTQLPVDRERTPWGCRAGRFARDKDLMLNLTFLERMPIYLKPNSIIRLDYTS